MWTVAGILDPDPSVTVESMIADVNFCRRSAYGLWVVPIRHELLIAR
ncbi:MULTISPECIES: hypothetical protein [unclassified Bradyrhizobium]|jgi:hypothetical protein|nr:MULTISPECIES: hypothetical protein [unclassified Bradyrhizobium]